MYLSKIILCKAVVLFVFPDPGLIWLADLGFNIPTD